MYVNKYLWACAHDLGIDFEYKDFNAVVAALKNVKNEPNYFDEQSTFDLLLSRPNVVYLRFNEEMKYLKALLDGSDLYAFCKDIVESDLARREAKAAVPLVKNPYRDGVYTREDVCNSRFRVDFYSDEADHSPYDEDEEDEYPAHVFLDLHAATVTDVVELASKAVQWSNTQYVSITDTQGKRRSSVVVIRGCVLNDGIKWVKPFNESERTIAQAKAKELHAEAAYESGWDNFSTARHLRNDAQKLLMGSVCSTWAKHPEVIGLFTQ